MTRANEVTILVLVLLCGNCFTQAQSATTKANDVVPTLVNFSGTLTDANGKPLTELTGVTFYLYANQQEVSPLWIEPQNVQPDANGRYSVILGATTSSGLPANLFVNGEARWLGVQPQGQAEQPRVMLLSVPYAMKAGDAQTIGGLPASAFMLAASANNTATASAPVSGGTSVGRSSSPATTSNVTTTGGSVGAIPVFSTSTNIQNSLLSQTGTTAINVKGALNLPATGIAMATGGKNSQPQNLVTSAFSSTTNTAVPQTFQWQAEPVGNDTTTPSGSLNLLFGQGTSKPAETGLNIASSGLINFAKGQTFPNTISGITTAPGSGLTGGGTSGTLNLALTNSCSTNQILEWNGSAWACTGLSGGGTITGVTAGTDLTGGGTSGNVTLNLDTSKVPQLNAANNFNGNQIITGNLTTNGSVTSQVGNFDGTSDTPLLNVSQSGTGDGADIAAANGYAGIITIGKTIGITATAICSGCNGTGVQGYSNGGTAVFGSDSAGTGSTTGVLGSSASSGGTGVFGSSPGVGVAGQSSALSGGTGVSGGATDGMGVYGSDGATTGTAYGVYGLSLSSAGNGVGGTSPYTGVYGNSTGASGYGVAGEASYTGVSGLAFASGSFGVSGFANTVSGTGVYGVGFIGVEGNGGFGSGVYGLTNGPASHISQTFGFYGGVQGDTGANWGNSYNNGQPTDCAMVPPPTPCAAGLVATADNANAGDIANNSTQWNTLYTVNFATAASGNAAPVFMTSGGTADSGKCSIDTNGDVGCTGRVGAYAPVEGGARRVSLYAMQSAENWFEDAGPGQLSDGFARVVLDPTFAETVNTGVDYHVFLTPNGDCKGLYVSQKTATSFEVHELGGGTSNIAFDYRIMAKRSGYENVRLADVTEKYKRMQMQERMANSRDEQQAIQSPPTIAQPVPPVPPELPKFPPPHKQPVAPTRQIAQGSR